MEDESAEPVSGKESQSNSHSVSRSKTDTKPSQDGKLSVGSKSSSALDSKPSQNTSAESSKARANFFTSPPEPLRLDPFKMFGMARKNPPKEEPVVQSSINGDVKSPTSGGSGIGEMESDEATDSQVRYSSIPLLCYEHLPYLDE